MTYEQARDLSKEVMRHITPFCWRCEVTGPVRREINFDYKRIQILSIPDTTSRDKLDALKATVNTRWGKPAKGAFPSRQTTINTTPAKLDFFWVTRATWGYMQFFRTGPEVFFIRAIQYWKQKFEGSASEGRLYDAAGNLLETPEEEDVFKALQCDFVPPQKRFDT